MANVLRGLASLPALLALVAPLIVGATGLSTNFESRVLAGHNRERNALGIAPLRWDPALATAAQTWADHLAVTGEFEHSPDGVGSPQGENLWAGTHGSYGVEAMVDAWIREKRHFKQGTFPNNSTTGSIEDVGHYTQLIWRDTNEVGCALAKGMREDILVCRYSAAGNYIGERPF